ncbi:response regulator transcription factor [Xanthobacter agilis]|uniref:response regulator transcription factor n=2 Tax=Xanthobacter agilis TaxID=47492 RepID=UPI0037285AFA
MGSLPMNVGFKVEAALGREAKVYAEAGRNAFAPPIHAAVADLAPLAGASGGAPSFAVAAPQLGSDPTRLTSMPWVVHIVDDDAAVCNSLKFAFELDGFDVRTYGGFQELMAADLPCRGCMIVDYNLPEINGLELLRELDRRNVHLPSFLITTNPSSTVRQRASAQGVSIIEKPLLSNQLSEAVRDSFTQALPC